MFTSCNWRAYKTNWKTTFCEYYQKFWNSEIWKIFN